MDYPKLEPVLTKQTSVYQLQLLCYIMKSIYAMTRSDYATGLLLSKIGQSQASHTNNVCDWSATGPGPGRGPVAAEVARLGCECDLPDV